MIFPYFLVCYKLLQNAIAIMLVCFYYFVWVVVVVVCVCGKNCNSLISILYAPQ